MHSLKEFAPFSTMPVRSKRDQSVGTSYDSPPPVGPGDCPVSPTMTRSSRKRSKDPLAEDEERPSAKRSHLTKQYRSKKSRVAQTIRRTTLPKAPIQTKPQPAKTRTSTRRRSAPNQTCSYGPIDEETDIEEDGKEDSTIKSQNRRTTVKSALKLVPLGPQQISVLRMNESMDVFWNRRPDTPSRVIDKDQDMRSDQSQSQVDDLHPAEMDNDGVFGNGGERPQDMEVDEDEHLNKDHEILSQIIVEEPQEKPPRHGHEEPSHTSASYTVTTNDDTASTHKDGPARAESISLPGRQNTPVPSASRRSSRLRSKHILYPLLESKQESAETTAKERDFQLKRRATTTTMTISMRVTMTHHHHPGQKLRTDNLLVMMKTLYVFLRDTIGLDLLSRPSTVLLSENSSPWKRECVKPSQYDPVSKLSGRRRFAFQTRKIHQISDLDSQQSHNTETRSNHKILISFLVKLSTVQGSKTSMRAF